MRFWKNFLGVIKLLAKFFILLVFSPIIILIFILQFFIAIGIKKEQRVSFKEAWEEAGDFLSD